MYCRGFCFYPVDLMKSHGTKYTLEENGIRIPLCGLPGIPPSAAEAIYNAREEGGEFTSVDDLRKRSGIGKSTIEVLRNNGILTNLSQTAQIELF